MALGMAGAALIAFAVLNFYLRIEPFAEWYIPIIWYGYIFVTDSLVFRFSERSLITSKTREFVFMLLLSVPFLNAEPPVFLASYTPIIKRKMLLIMTDAIAFV